MPDSKLVIEAKRVITKDGPVYEITKLRAMARNEVPDDYLKSLPYVVMDGKSMYVGWKGYHAIVTVGNTVSLALFKELRHVLKRSGHRLQRIRSRMRRTAGDKWSGSVKMEI